LYIKKIKTIVTNSTKQLSILSSPLERIATATETSSNTLLQINQVVVSINTYALETVQELKKQTSVLLDIKGLLKGQNKTLEQGVASKGGPTNKMFSPMDAKDVGLTALMIIGVAGAIVGAAAIFSLIPVISVPQLLTALAVAGIFALIAPLFVRISDTLAKNASLMAGTNRAGNINPAKSSSLFALVGSTALTLMAIAGSLVLSAAILSLMPVINPAQLLMALAVSVIMIPAAFAYSMILKATKDIKPEGLVFAAIALPLMALGIVGVAYAFMLMPSNQVAPDPLWVLKSAFAIGLFAVGFYFIMKAIKGADIKEIAFGAIAIPLMAIAIAGVGAIFSMLPQVNPAMAPDPIWVLKSAFAIGLFAVGFYFIMKAIKGASIPELIYGAIAIPLMALGILGVAFIFQALSTISEYVAPDPLWVLKAGFAILIFSIPFYLVSKAIKGMGPAELLFMTLAIPIVAFGVLATAWIFQSLAGIKYFAPDVSWTLKAGISVVIFGGMLYLSSKTIGRLSLKDLTMALIGVVVTSFAIVAVAWLFQLLPSNLIAPPIDWTTSTALALGLMGAAIVVMGIAVAALTPATLLLGALGIIVAAITILAVGWILAQLAPVMPNLVTVAQGITSALLTPINGIIDVFARFKNEIGIENMIGLATGVAALGGAWLIFSAAMGGASVVGGIGTAIGGLFEGIGKLFGGDGPSPIELLERLAVAGPNIQNLSKPLIQVGTGFSMINVASGGVVKALKAVVDFNDNIDEDDFTKKAKATEKIAKSYKIIADSSRTMNVKAIQATTSMFASLTDLAKNKGESAMSVLADKLLDAVKQLSGTVENLEKSVENQGKATSGLPDVISGVMDTVKETVIGVKKTTDKMNKDTKDAAMDLQPLIDAINELEARFDTAIKVIDVTVV
jgi:hypothetical protein